MIDSVILDRQILKVPTSVALMSMFRISVAAGAISASAPSLNYRLTS